MSRLLVCCFSKRDTRIYNKLKKISTVTTGTGHLSHSLFSIQPKNFIIVNKPIQEEDIKFLKDINGTSTCKALSHLALTPAMRCKPMLTDTKFLNGNFYYVLWKICFSNKTCSKSTFL